MKISKDENGALILDGENRTILFTTPDNGGLKYDDLKPDGISQIKNFIIYHTENGEVDKMKMVTEYLSSFNRL
jgi:hypothetical protein